MQYKGQLMASWIAALKGKTKTLDNLEDLFFLQLQELYDVEQQIIDALPDMAEACSSMELRRAFEMHLAQTQRQKERLEEIFRRLNRDAEATSSEAIRGLVADATLIINAKGDPQVKDAALIAAGQAVEHYEMACYGAARTFAQFLGWEDVAEMLQQTLDEEGRTDKELTAIAVGKINRRAV
jgi:ferritin-like metal-binding protein YciE